VQATPRRTEDPLSPLRLTEDPAKLRSPDTLQPRLRGHWPRNSIRLQNSSMAHGGDAARRQRRVALARGGA
jgi:hypothetical protein